MSALIQISTTETAFRVKDSEKVMKLIKALRDLDDVQDILTNTNFVGAA